MDFENLMLWSLDDLFLTVEATFKDFQWFRFALVTLVVNWTVGFFINLRQRSQLQDTSMPEAVRKLGISEEKFQENNLYALDKMNFKLVASLYGLVKSIAMLWFFFDAGLWSFTKTQMDTRFGCTFESYPVLLQLSATFVETVFVTVIGLPWGLYYDFVLEEKWGFNKKTLKLFFMDMLKELGIGMVINSIIMTVILYIIDWAGKYWFMYSWGFVACFVFIMMWIYPTVIQPCFNKVEELEQGESKEGQIRTAIEKLAAKIDYPLKQLYKVDGSKRSGHSNAYMYGFCSNKRIVLFDTLMDQMTVPQINAVLGHELGHWYHWHTVYMMAKMQFMIFSMFFIVGLFLNDQHLASEFGFSEIVTTIQLGLAAKIMNPASVLLKFWNNYQTRTMEYQADRFAVKLGYGEELKEGLIVMVGENKKEMNPDWLYATYNYSHPGLVERNAGIDAAISARAKKQE